MQVIGGDGGFRRTPAAFPPEGLFTAVAQRWDVVCDFTGYADKQLLLWNEFNDWR